MRNGLLTFIFQVNQNKNIWDVREQFASSMVDGNHGYTCTRQLPSLSAWQVVVHYHLVPRSPMCWPPANITSFFFFYPSHRLTADPSEPVVGDSDWLLCSKPRPPSLLQPRGATAALNSQNPMCVCACARARLYARDLIFLFLYFDNLP